MKNLFVLVLFLLGFGITNAQEDARTLLRGKVLYRNSNVPNENVINTTSEYATITNDNGEFGIRVKAGDELVFTAINYQMLQLRVTQEMIENNRLVVEVNEKVTELDEVVVSPENQEKFLQLQNERIQKQYDYEIDRSTEVENIALSQQERGMQNGLNFVNIFKALTKSKTADETEARPTLKLSDVMRQVYDDRFFVEDLHLPQDKINNFLVYCDDKIPTQSLLKKDNEFQLIDFLVTYSKLYLKEQGAEK
ncbi:carboxypeptidase-like regulatory domain-containing protein [Flavobacteriaceae bacterium KMM 6897]|nr:carboxypeptidase-like regulatory domain-containing protein [Flavobacteriaceae bacterium KMM 6897]MEB8347349.1 carboxypeptidase-like regulatory domain-containing protein [Flavobacteriaceae bacterium KMM 6898]